MKSYPYVPSMVQAITVLTVLKMMTKAQTSCGTGSMNGKVMYERLPNTQLQGFDDDIVRDTAPPFMVLEKCQDLCLRDRASNNIVRTCTSFDFQPGSRIATFNGGPEYEESTCYLTREQAAPEGMGNLMLVPNSVHFSEVCITSNRPDRECPNRRYIFERHPRKKLKLPAADIKEMQASNRSECEDKCLNEFSFVCRSASFDSAMRMCTLSRFTRRTHPELLEDDPSSDYLENTCLNAERRCDGLGVFIKEENKRLGGPFEVDLFSNITLEDCQAMCVRAEKYFCRSIEYDEMTKQCTISEEDSISQKDDIGVSSSPTHHFYDFACLDSPRGSEYPDNSVTSHLFTGKRPDTAFQRYRNSRLGGEHHSEISGRSLSECLDECLRQPSFQCRSAVYSERFRTCRLSRYNQKDGMRIIYDADYDYYENLMLGTEGDGNGQKPDRPDPHHPRPGYRPGDRYPPSRYPPGGDRDRYPGYDNRIPDDRYPDDRYPPPGRYPPGRPGDRYPPDDDRYPVGPDRYPPGDRYPPPGDRYPHRYPPGGGDRYPDRRPSYPGGYDRYGGDRDRYGGDRDRDRDRYGGGDRDRDRDRYGGDRDRDRDRYGGGERDRYGGNRYGSRHHYFYGEDRYSGRDHYGGGSRDQYGSDYDRYGGSAGGGGGKYLPLDDRGTRRHPGYPSHRPSYDDPRYGDRYNDKYPGAGGPPGHGGPGGDRYGGSRFTGFPRPQHSYYGDDRDGGNRWFFRPDRDRRPGGRPFDAPPPYEPHPHGHRRPISPGPDGPIYDGPNYLPGAGPPQSLGGGGGRPPYISRCDESDNFKQAAVRQRIRKDYVRRFIVTSTLGQCERECADTRDFICRSFNYREGPGQYDGERENCELSDRDSRDIDISNPQYFENTGNFDYYERSNSRQGGDPDCLDVTQVCNDDGMEFTLRTPEPYYGRIYTYGFYDRCFFRGNGGTLNVLRISGGNGYPECGTQRYGDTMTNIVVVQFSDHVQTSKDKRFNLTCLFRGPGEAVVSSGFIGAGSSSSGSPIPIEYLPAENTLSSKVRLMILYQGRPTTTIAVGDPLTFRLEAQDGYNYVQDIFATNVVARDPYSGRSVQLIDRFGCPVDSYVFPELDRGRSGDSLEARFNAFKIPESNFLVFEATVRTCRDGCQPAYCPSTSGRSEPSFGRRRRSLNDTTIVINNTIIEDTTNDTTVSFPQSGENENENDGEGGEGQETKNSEDPEFVREMIEVFESREELQQEARRALPLAESVCMTSGEYHGLISALLALAAVLLTFGLLAGIAYRRYGTIVRKNLFFNSDNHHHHQHNHHRSTTPSTTSYPTTTRSSGLSIFAGSGFQKPFMGTFGRARPFSGLNEKDIDGTADHTSIIPPAPNGLFDDPSEPIYTDPSLFERSRSLRSIAVSQKRRHSPGAQP